MSETAAPTAVAPSDFTLTDDLGASYRLSDHLARPVALLFYRGDW